MVVVGEDKSQAGPLSIFTGTCRVVRKLDWVARSVGGHAANSCPTEAVQAEIDENDFSHHSSSGRRRTSRRNMQPLVRCAGPFKDQALCISAKPMPGNSLD